LKPPPTLESVLGNGWPDPFFCAVIFLHRMEDPRISDLSWMRLVDSVPRGGSPWAGVMSVIAVPVMGVQVPGGYVRSLGCLFSKRDCSSCRSDPLGCSLSVPKRFYALFCFALFFCVLKLDMVFLKLNYSSLDGRKSHQSIWTEFLPFSA